MLPAVLFLPRIGIEFLHGHSADDMDDDEYEDDEDAVDDEDGEDNDHNEDAVDDEDNEDDDKDDGADDDMDEDDIGRNLLQQFLVLLSTSQCVLGGHL